MSARSIIKWSTFGFVAVIAGLLAACSGGDDATPTPSVCEQREEVQRAVQQLADVNVLAEETNELKDSLENLRTELGVLADAVAADLADEVQDLEDAVSNAEETLAGLDDRTLGENIDTVSGALADVARAAAALTTALQRDCG